MSTENNGSATSFEKVGALWKKEGKSGVYYSGEITLEGKTVKILVFPFKTKSKDNLPDAKICLYPPKDGTGKPVVSTPAAQRPKPVAKPSVVAEEDDLAF